jgi:hypothetical protein
MHKWSIKKLTLFLCGKPEAIVLKQAEKIRIFHRKFEDMIFLSLFQARLTCFLQCLLP